MDQRRRDALKVKKFGLRALGQHGNGHLLQESIAVVHFLKCKARIKEWIAHTTGFDITVVSTFRVAPNLQRQGIGKFMRRKQIEHIRSRLPHLWQRYVAEQLTSSSQQVYDDKDYVEDEPTYLLEPFRVLSLVASQTGGASLSTSQPTVGFNERVFQEFNFEVDTGIDSQTNKPISWAFLERLNEAFPMLKLSEITATYNLCQRIPPFRVRRNVGGRYALSADGAPGCRPGR
eukprot:6180622-Pleurochrysis_carterae.AAC.1